MAQSVKFRSRVESPFDERRTFFLGEMATHRQRGATCERMMSDWWGGIVSATKPRQNEELWAERQRQDIEKGGE
jgi:hypothetical protein